ncbi:MAG: hypothetical protein KJP25_04885 [Gammaproteobacteria bacterium]|nr:hypothetical protein [Gammaproteobacteria bacterium]MBT8151965.1 hypothetical protein [Gammaproteobacteria bacterium]NND39618.1 hypothetical protein [Pseudomonadales bacterium]NNM12306.1 hypothetical protein [Pseudomonadales bacterium]RZV58178.1 MAG: hypothetical protein EX270_02955 [Pseudomonadales bacterium]
MADSEDTKKDLLDAWDDMIQSLQEARNAIDQPELMPPPASERNLAEGYRYLMGYLHSAVERAFHSDPDRPQFRNALSTINRATIDNPDAVYFYAPIDGSASYMLHGQMGDARHWRGQPALSGARKAPHYLIFETSSGELAGDSGDLRELQPGMKTQTGMLDASSIDVNEDGSFNILLAPERPGGYSGNFIPTLKVVERPHPADPNLPPERYASYISGRQLFYDWEHEEAIHFEIVQLDASGEQPAPYSADSAAQQLRRLGNIVRGQMHFWNAFWAIPMGVYGERPGTMPGMAFPRNAFNTINAASGATGGGMSTNLYAGGVFELERDEALVIEIKIKLQPNYFGFQLGNLWGESLDYANRISSLNGYQTVADADGVIRLVVAHQDPGVHNWLDTDGHREGFLSPRWAYSHTPEPEDWPEISARKVSFGQLSAELPASTVLVSAEQRQQQIALRQRHVQKRYRVF